MKNIKRLRKARDITQEDFSEMLGVSCQSVSRWENNVCYPDLELLPVIAEFFGISTDKLMGIDEAVEKAAASPIFSAASAKARPTAIPSGMLWSVIAATSMVVLLRQSPLLQQI